MSYSNETAEGVLKWCIKKLYKSFKQEIIVKFVTPYKTKKLSFFANTKNKTRSLCQSSLVYKFTCPSCSCKYIGKTEWTLHERAKEHAYPNKKSNQQSAIYEHLSACSHYNHKLDMFNINNHDVKCNKLTLTRLEVTLLFLTKQMISTNCYLKKHY